MNQAPDNNGSRVAAATGTTRPMPVSLPSMATTTGAIATPTMGAVPLSSSPDGNPRFADCPAQYTKGSASLGDSSPEDSYTHPRPGLAGDELFQTIVSFESLHRAWKRARAGKRDSHCVQAFAYDLEVNLIQLQNELIWKTWTPGPYNTFEVHEPKTREIHAPAFRDRVVHHSLVAALTPIFERSFHGRSYACRVSKGTHAGASKAEQVIRRTVRKHGKAYCLKADIQKYFPSVDHDRLKSLLRRRVTDLETLRVCDTIIDTAPGSNGVGIPLGNLTSQLFANIYLHELDHYVGNVLQVCGYVRYMDDFIVVSHDLAALQVVLTKVRKFLAEQLRLTLNRKTAIFPISAKNGRAVDFLGYKIYASHRRLRRRSVIKGRKYARTVSSDPCDENLNRLTSWYSHARYAEPRGMMREIFSILATGDQTKGNQ